MPTNRLNLLKIKQLGGTPSAAQVQRLLGDFAQQRMPAAEMGEWLRAIQAEGLEQAETLAWTRCMADSGTSLSWPEDPRPVVDKHSTGGVGDKTAMVLAPLLAAAGCRVPMITARGHACFGGTLDKLEAIPGFRVDLSVAEIRQIVDEVGCVICAQSPQMVPADRALFALRQDTDTIACEALIAASILSKKLVESLDWLVLDVKWGSGSLIGGRRDSLAFCRMVAGLCQELALPASILLSQMDQPLGRSVGNWLEIQEVVACLDGEGPADTMALSLRLGAEILKGAGLAHDVQQGTTSLQQLIESGAAKASWERLLRAQGADMQAYQRQLQQGTTAPVVRQVRAVQRGFVNRCDARSIGQLVLELGGGRRSASDRICHRVGFDQLAKPGELRDRGTVIGRVHAETEEQAERAAAGLGRAFAFAEAPGEAPPLVELP